MKIAIVCDSYKGSNSSIKVASLIEEGAKAVFPNAIYIKIPIADGGEGTVEALTEGLSGQRITVNAHDPLGRPITAFYGDIEGKAVMEMAAAGGLPLLEKNERNPLFTSTYGVGEILVAILDAGYTDITIGIGGSATNDGGAGMAQALGYRFLDDSEQELPPGGAALTRLRRIDDACVHPLLSQAHIHVACDVNNALLGNQGASAVYGPQKGASPNMVTELDTALKNFAHVVEQWKGKTMRKIPGSGAAGGLGFGLVAFCDAEMKSGIDTILDLVNFESQISESHLVITGEGKLDGQSIHGKVPIGVANRVHAMGIPVLAVVGDIGPGASVVYDYGIDSVMSTVDRAMSLDDAIARSQECLLDASERACRMIRIGLKIAYKFENRILK